MKTKLPRNASELAKAALAYLGAYKGDGCFMDDRSRRIEEKAADRLQKALENEGVVFQTHEEILAEFLSHSKRKEA